MIKEIDINKLTLLEDNPRKISKENMEKLKKSLEDDPGFLEFDSVLVNHTDNKYIVFAGNHRVMAAKELGWEKIIVKIGEDMPIKLMRQRALKQNERYTESDWDKLAKHWKVEIEELDLPEVKIDLLPDEESPEEKDIPAPKKEVISVLGDLYELNGHRVLCGDSTKIDDVEKLMNGEKADMVFTDPPYLMGFTGNVHADGSKSHNAKHGAILNDKMSKADGDEFILNVFEIINIFCTGAYYVCFYRLGLDYIFRAMDGLSMTYKALIIWSKGNHTLSNSDYMSKYEPIVYGWVKDHNFYGDRSNFDIWEVDRTKKNDLHPTMKPVALCAKAINNSSKPGESVLDLFLGSGSTLMACEQTNRKCYGIELDPKYTDVILRRWARYQHENDRPIQMKKNGVECDYNEWLKEAK